MTTYWYKMTRNDEVIYRLMTNKNALSYTKLGWEIEKIKTKRYSMAHFTSIVKKILNRDGRMGTTDLWEKCVYEEHLFLSRETFLKKLNQLHKEVDWLGIGAIGSSYTWYIK